MLRLCCTGCGTEHALETKRCSCNNGILRVVLSFEHWYALPVTDASGIWRYEALLPEVTSKISFYEGRTPVLPSKRLGDELNISLAYKDETRNPTGSFKDRAAAVMLSVSKYLGIKGITTASSGNAAGAIALYSTLADIQAYIFMFQPSKQKLTQTLSYGATCFIVDTTSESSVLRLAENASEIFGWSLLNTTAAANPFVIEGYKTIAYELYEKGEIPDWIAIPVSSGSLLIGIWQGFCDLQEMGLLQSPPRLLGVQPEGSAPIAKAFAAQSQTVPPIQHAETIATALSLEDPGVAGIETLRSVRENSGMMLSVPDEHTIAIACKLSRQDGIFGEASGVISVAGVVEARKQGIIEPNARVICVISGSGLKDPAVFLQDKSTVQSYHVPDSIEAVASVLRK